MSRYPQARIGWLLAAALSVGCSAVAGSIRDGKGDPLMNVDPDLAAQMAASRGSSREFPVIVTLQRADDMPAVLAKGIRPTLAYQSMPAFAANLSADEIAAIAGLPQVQLIELDRAASVLSPR